MTCRLRLSLRQSSTNIIHKLSVVIDRLQNIFILLILRQFTHNKMSTKNKSVKNPPNTKTITDYFQLKKRIEFVDVPVVNSTISESFYDECLDLQLNQNKCSENCQSWKLELKNRLLVQKGISYRTSKKPYHRVYL